MNSDDWVKGYRDGERAGRKLAASRQSRSKALFDIVAKSHRRGLTDVVVDGERMTDLIELPMTRDEADEFRRLLSNVRLMRTERPE